jgi:tetratricopeptide (TPR) repeat protein
VSARETLERKVSASATDAASRYQLAVLLLQEYETTHEQDLLDRAREYSSRAIEIRPSHARSHAMLAYTHDLTDGGAEQALQCFREARRLDPVDKVIDVYVLTLLADLEREEEALAGIETAAARHDVDVHELRGQLTAAGFPSDAGSLVMNGFIHARNFFRSSLWDEAEKIRNSLERGRKRRHAQAERERCSEDQRELERSFDASLVPEEIRPLAVWASRYGVGDDYCRPMLLGRLSKAERARLISEVDENAAAIYAWLDSFGDTLMPAEPAAFLYLSLGVEEIRE